MAGIRPRKPAPIGAVFGALTVVGDGEPYVRQRPDRIRPTTASRWRVRCECGTEKDVLPSHLRQGRYVSCGCQTDHSRPARYFGCKWPTGCDRPHNSRGLCKNHYTKFQKRVRAGVAADLLLADSIPLDRRRWRTK